MTSDVCSKVYAILAKHSQLPAEKFTPETSLEEAGVDSLNMMEILFELEDSFNIDIPDSVEEREGVSQLRTAGDVVRAVESLLKEA
ncbi:MAG: acyl carrier protein [bacterium]